MTEPTTAVAIISGGMDSTVAAWKAREQFDNLWLVSFDYGQRHNVELEYAEVQALKMDVRGHYVISLKGLSPFMSGSALTNETLKVPEGHYADDSMRVTVVPNRNAIMLNCAAALAVREKAIALFTGVHAGDHPVYPDCRPEFLVAVENSIIVANEGFIHPDFQIIAPFINQYKSDIVLEGERLRVNWLDTWSCYQGDWFQCGRCSTCVERKVAFLQAGVIDPTEYEYGYDDYEFLRSALPDFTCEVLDTKVSTDLKIRENLIYYSLIDEGDF